MLSYEILLIMRYKFCPNTGALHIMYVEVAEHQTKMNGV